MLELGKFYLQLAFMRSGASSKYLEDQARSAEDAFVQFLFEISFLGRRKVITKNNQFAFMQGEPISDLFDFTATDKRTGMGKSSIAGEEAHRLQPS